MDIDGWLRGIGLEHYVQTFRDNAIDADVLCDLTDEHLRELGLPAWGTAQVGPFALVRPSQPVASGRRSTSQVTVAPLTLKPPVHGRPSRHSARTAR